jgi:hypothetical protein
LLKIVDVDDASADDAKTNSAVSSVPALDAHATSGDDAV